MPFLFFRFSLCFLFVVIFCFYIAVSQCVTFLPSKKKYFRPFRSEARAPLHPFFTFFCCKICQVTVPILLMPKAFITWLFAGLIGVIPSINLPLFHRQFKKNLRATQEALVILLYTYFSWVGPQAQLDAHLAVCLAQPTPCPRCNRMLR